jgi:hypothetical protein
MKEQAARFFWFLDLTSFFFSGCSLFDSLSLSLSLSLFFLGGEQLD